jgi:hypothetical protein
MTNGFHGEAAMRMVMDMSTGKILEDEFGAFETEVLNAEWTPPSPDIQAALQLGLQEAHPDRVASNVDADGFLNSVYRNQR